MQDNKLRNATYGQYPKLQYYCVMHKDFGAKMYIVRGGSSGGKKQPTTWAGVKFWYDWLSPQQRQQIIEQNYFNRPEAVAAALAAHGPDYFKGPFDPNKFLVRPCSHARTSIHPLCLAANTALHPATAIRQAPCLAVLLHKCAYRLDV